MNDDAHVVMEYFDRYNSSIKKEQHVRLLLNDKKIAYAADV
jgi:hypothetical protein